MSKRVLSILQYLFFLGLGLFLVWYQFHGMTPGQRQRFSASLQEANYTLLLPIIACSLASHLSRAARWRLLISPMGYTPSLANAFSVTMVGYLANSAVPRLGEVLKCTLLGRYEKIPVDKLIGTILTERLFDLFCYAIFIGITLLVQLDVAGPYLRQSLQSILARNPLPWWVWLLAGISFAILLWLTVRWLLRRFVQHAWLRKLKGIIRGLREGLGTIMHLRKKGWFIAHSIFIWSMYLVQIYIGFRAMTATAGLGWGAACSVLTLATLAMILTPGGIGAFPIGVQEVLLRYGVVNGSFGWLMWGASTSIIVVTGLICLLALPYINKKRQQHETIHSHTG